MPSVSLDELRGLIERHAGANGGPRTVGDDRPGIAVSDMSSDLVDSVGRLLRLLDRPSDMPILAASLEREILWRVIDGPQGALVRQIGLADSRMSQIGRAVRWLGSHFAETIRIEDLAGIAGMSVTSLHRHFRIVTSVTPIQYQKQLRHQAARAPDGNQRRRLRSWFHRRL